MSSYQHFTLFIIILFSVSSLSAQKVKWSKLHKKDGIFSIVYPVSLTDNEYFVVSRPKKQNEVLIYDLNHKLKSVKQVDLGRDKKGAVMTEVFETAGGAYVIYNWQNKPKKQMEIYAAPFKDGKIGKAKRIHSHDFKSKGSFVGMLNLATLANAERFGGLIQSADKTKIAYVSYTSSESNKRYDELSIAVFDQNLNTLWKKTKDFPYKDKNLSITQIMLNNSGDVFASTAILKRKLFDDDKEPDYGFQIFQISEDREDDFIFDLEEGSFPYTIGLTYEGKDELNIVGTYTTGEYKGNLTGVFFGTLNVNTGDFDNRVYPFEKSFLEGLIKKRKIKKDKGLETSYYIKHVIKFADGSHSFIAEKYYVEISSQYVNGSWQNNTVYNSDEIIIPHFSPDGTLENIEKIEKDYGSSFENFTSYAFIVKDKKIILIYNDSKKRSERKDLGGAKNALYTDLTIIGEDGKIESQKTLFTSKDDNVDTYFCPGLTLKNDNKILIFGYSGLKKYKFGLIEF